MPTSLTRYLLRNMWHMGLDLMFEAGETSKDHFKFESWVKFPVLFPSKLWTFSIQLDILVEKKNAVGRFATYPFGVKESSTGNLELTIYTVIYPTAYACYKYGDVYIRE
jgi:hypothetical protein